MEIDFKKYTDIELLECYAFFYSSYLGTQLGAHAYSLESGSVPRKIGYTDLTCDISVEVRKEYFSRKDADKGEMYEIEATVNNKIKELTDPETLGKMIKDYGDYFEKYINGASSKSNESVN